jgi:hypothetical protein
MQDMDIIREMKSKDDEEWGMHYTWDVYKILV